MKKPDSFERLHMRKVAELGCCLCNILGYPGTPAQVQVHHIREGQGMGERSSHYLTVPLCPEHHQGASGIHGLGVKGFYTRYKLDELDLLAATIRLLEQ